MIILYLWRNKYLNISHAYPVTVLLDRDYVKRVNDSPDSAIHNTFSHFAAFFIVAVTKRFNVDRVDPRVYFFIISQRNIRQNEKKIYVHQTYYSSRCITILVIYAPVNRKHTYQLPIMILPQVHLRKPCYDFSFL